MPKFVECLRWWCQRQWWQTMNRFWSEILSWSFGSDNLIKLSSKYSKNQSHNDLKNKDECVLKLWKIMIVNKIKDCRYYNKKSPYTVTDDIILKWLSYVLLTSYWKLFFMMLPAVYPTNTEGMWTDLEVESETNTRSGRVWIKQLFFLASAATFLFFPTLHLVTVHCFNAFYFPTGLKKVHDRELRIYWFF